jgi:hypothetical protein
MGQWGIGGQQHGVQNQGQWGGHHSGHHSGHQGWGNNSGKGQWGNNSGFTAPVFKPGQNYVIYAVHSQGLKAIDVSQNMADFGNLIIYSFHGAPNQRFTF